MNLKELYQEIILEHGKNPRNLGKIENFNKDAKGNNPLCGDNVHVYLKLNEQRKVEGISFEGSGCAISMASASIMTDLIKGKSDNEAKEIIESVTSANIDFSRHRGMRPITKYELKWMRKNNFIFDLIYLKN